jgi:hypothetical protein
MNLKDMLNQVLAQSAFLQRAGFFGSTDPDDLQMVAIANRVVQEIRDMYNWEILRNRFTIIMQDGVERYNLPDDFKAYVPNSGWQDEGSRQIELPVPDGRWYMYQNSAYSDGGTYRCRLSGNQIEVFEPDPGQKIVFFYISDSTVESQLGVRKPLFTEDEDNYIMDDQMLILGIQAHWAETKLLPQAQAWKTNYRAKVNEQIGITTGGRTIGGFTRGSRYDKDSPYYPLWQT